MSRTVEGPVMPLKAILAAAAALAVGVGLMLPVPHVDKAQAHQVAMAVPGEG